MTNEQVEFQNSNVLSAIQSIKSQSVR